MTNCSECHRLREETAALFSDYILRKDELSMTRKDHKAYAAKRRELERVQGQLNEARKREHQHRDETHYGYGAPDETLSIEQRLSQLRERIALGDDDGVQQVIFDLSPIHNGWSSVPDQVAEGLLTVLRDPAMFHTRSAGHVLNYFAFESPRLSSRQKDFCKAFLKAHGDSFTDELAMQVVTELRMGCWLN